MKYLIMALVLNSRIYSRGAYDLIDNIVEEIDVDEYSSSIEIFNAIIDALSDGEYLAKLDANETDVNKAYEIIEDGIKILKRVAKTHPWWKD